VGGRGRGEGEADASDEDREKRVGTEIARIFNSNCSMCTHKSVVCQYRDRRDKTFHRSALTLSLTIVQCRVVPISTPISQTLLAICVSQLLEVL